MTCTPSELRSAFQASRKEHDPDNTILHESGLVDHFMALLLHPVSLAEIRSVGAETIILLHIMNAFKAGYACGERIALAHTMERMLRTMEEGVK